MDYETGIIHIIDSTGKLGESISLPSDMEKINMLKLYARKDGSVWLYYEEYESDETQGGTIRSYYVGDLESRPRTYVDGFSKDGDSSYSIVKKDQSTVNLKEYALVDGHVGRTYSDISISANEILGQINILNIDEGGSVIMDIYDVLDMSMVAGEYTVRKFSQGVCESVATIDLTGYYFMPYSVVNVSEAGDLFQIKCYEDKIQIIKKDFIDERYFKSNIDNIKIEMQNAEENVLVSAVATVNAPNTLNDTMDNAIDCCNLTWTYKASNAVNPNSNNVTVPDYLSGVSKPSSQTGIPYCWGGFDGTSSSSSSTWLNFSDAMNNNKFAGNINTNGNYKSGTAGLDCSGFVSSSAGFSQKLGTSNLASSQYTQAISSSSRRAYDMYVKSGSHVLYYVSSTTSGIRSRESTVTGDDKTKLYTRSLTELSGYTLRRFNGG